MLNERYARYKEQQAGYNKAHSEERKAATKRWRTDQEVFWQAIKAIAAEINRHKIKPRQNVRGWVDSLYVKHLPQRGS